MKRLLETVVRLTVLFSIMAAVTSCGGDEEEGLPGGPGGPGGPAGYVGNVQPLPGGGMRIGFSSTNTNVYHSGLAIVGGLLTGNTANGGFCNLGGGAWGYAYCGGFGCECFSHPSRPTGTGVLSPGAYVGSPAGNTVFYTGNSQFVAGATLAMNITQTGQSIGTAYGHIDLPPQFVQANLHGLPQGSSTQSVGLAFDLRVLPPNTPGSYPVSGGVLIYTSGDQNSGYHGVFVRF
ncbi:MAG: hypothetical protein AB1540_01455 [Bdellovibrionota bacterium]